mmetsp:Transcript_3281/g.8914  ORF Transcript_3281/g.8914 Transcript_3281/m.8914 type:complete len:452 (+) Transcript_3281:76-1431(+)
MAPVGEMSARQRKHVYLHSTIFSEEGPDNRSVYKAERQAEVYESLQGSLRKNNLQAPEIRLPKPEDMRITQHAGHPGMVFPTNGQNGCNARALNVKTNEDVLVHDGEVEPVVHASGKDTSIPREFWATSVNLQWHDTRHERCREQGPQRNAQGARHAKMQDLSSEIFGKERLTEMSTTNARHELLADSADHLQLDSRMAGFRPSEVDGGGAARARAQHNLKGSTAGLLPVGDGSSVPPPSAHDTAPEIPSNMPRRRQEKNFSDLFDTQMGERGELRGKREEILGTSSVSFLDARSEIATRNKGHWQENDEQTAPGRKHHESASSLFDRGTPGPGERPPVDPQHAKVTSEEHSLWESRDGMRTTVEIARRRVAKDFQRDFEDPERLNHHARRQQSLASSPVFGFGGGPPPPGCGATGAPPMEPRPVAGSVPASRSAKDTKLAFLQSGIGTFA